MGRFILSTLVQFNLSYSFLFFFFLSQNPPKETPLLQASNPALICAACGQTGVSHFNCKPTHMLAYLVRFAVALHAKLLVQGVPGWLARSQLCQHTVQVYAGYSNNSMVGHFFDLKECKMPLTNYRCITVKQLFSCVRHFKWG